MNNSSEINGNKGRKKTVGKDECDNFQIQMYENETIQAIKH